MTVAIIIPAAGSGSRFGGDIPKQFRMLGGKPILQRVVERFLVHERVGRIVVAVTDILLAEVKQTDRVRFVAGGATRQQSVSNALAAVGDEELVAVHDAVRPFFTYETFDALLDAAAEHGAAFPGLPVTDTIHLVRDETIVQTPERQLLFAAQTPQCFRTAILRDVLARAASDDATDEAGLAARLGYAVRVVPGDAVNFKITRPEDLELAERMLEQAT
ncbi:MAG: 2-C-methyl-D-erythritol 4-phosphate cytidylyltransferase [Acidobacteriota bacterium]